MSSNTPMAAYRVLNAQIAIAMIGGLSICVSSAHADVIVDNFTSGSTSLLTTDPGNTQVYEDSLTDAFGDSRIVRVRNFGGSADTAASGGSVASDTFAGQRGGPGTGDVQLTYQGEEFPGTAGGGNFTDFADAVLFRFDFSANSSPALNVTVQFDSFDPFFANFSQQNTVSVAVPVGGGIVDVPVAGLDLGTIDVINVTFGYDFGVAGFDAIVNESFTVNSIVAVVPEPGSLTLVAAATGLVFIRRRVV